MTSASDVCRVCLAGNIRMLHIDNMHLLQLFEKLTNSKLNTESDAGMPSTVCYVCHRQLQRYHLFSDMARRSDKTMRDLLHNNIEITCRMITMLSLAIKPTLSMAATQHMSVIDYSNTLSTLTTVKVEQLVIEETVKSEEIFLQELQETPDEDTRFIYSSNELCAENISHNSLIFSEKKQTDIHLNIYCDVCHRKFYSKHQLIKHLKVHTSKKAQSCNHCDKTFTHKNAYTCHMRSHTVEKPYSCTLCGKAFAEKRSLTNHMRSHTGEKPYSCTLCGKAFAHKSHFSTHMRIHTGEKPYSCIICDKAFSQKSHLSRHMQIHAEVKPYLCNKCYKKFATKGFLASHMRLHTGEKPYSCVRCDKAFAYKSHLSRHMRIHTREKPYSS